jgi:hypothetical protein
MVSKPSRIGRPTRKCPDQSLDGEGPEWEAIWDQVCTILKRTNGTPSTGVMPSPRCSRASSDGQPAWQNRPAAFMPLAFEPRPAQFVTLGCEAENREIPMPECVAGLCRLVVSSFHSIRNFSPLKP